MERNVSLKFTFLCIFVLVAMATAREPILPVRGPSSYALLGIDAEIRNDIYGGEIGFAGEFAPCNCASVYIDAGYRLVSYDFDMDGSLEMRHDVLDMDENGFNETYLGVKLMPYPFFGVDVSWRFPPGGGSQVHKFHRFGISPMGIYDISKRLKLGASLGYYTFMEKQNYLPGDELDVKGSLVWNFFWDANQHRGWELSHVFLYRWRLQESENHGLKKPYQKMHDLHQGFRMRSDVGYYFAIAGNALGVSGFYEMNRGSLFGGETGHTIGLYSKFRFY